MSKSIRPKHAWLLALALSATFAAGQSQGQPSQNQTEQESKSNKPQSQSTKKAANPKKPAEAKNGGDPDKVKTDERLSTRGLKPPPKAEDKPPKPDNPPKS